MFHLSQFLVGDFGEVGEVESEIVRTDEGALLLDMGAEDFPQGMVQKMGSGVVRSDIEPSGGVNLQCESPFAVLRDALGDVDRKIVLLDCVEDPDMLPACRDHFSGVADLATHFRVEGGAVEDELDHGLVLLLDGAALHQPYPFELEVVISEEGLLLTFGVHCPVAELVGGGVPGPLFLFLQLDIEAVHIELLSIFLLSKNYILFYIY